MGEVTGLPLGAGILISIEWASPFTGTAAGAGGNRASGTMSGPAIEGGGPPEWREMRTDSSPSRISSSATSDSSTISISFFIFLMSMVHPPLRSVPGRLNGLARSARRPHILRALARK